MLGWTYNGRFDFHKKNGSKGYHKVWSVAFFKHEALVYIISLCSWYISSADKLTPELHRVHFTRKRSRLEAVLCNKSFLLKD